MTDRVHYDPNWRSRHGWWEDRLKALSPVKDRKAWTTAQDALHLAHDSQFRTVAEFAAFRYGFYRSHAQQFGFHTAFPPLADDATDDDVIATCKAAMLQVEHAARLARRPPLGQPPGLKAFSSQLRRGWRRSVAKIMVEQSKLPPSSGLGITPQEWTVLIEWKRRRAHVCLIRPDNRSLGPDWNMEHVATIAFKELLAAPPCRPWAAFNPRRVNFYVYVPFAQSDPLMGEYFDRRSFVWQHGRYHSPVRACDVRETYAHVPTLIASLDPRPAQTVYLVPIAPETR